MRSTVFVTPKPNRSKRRARPAAYLSRTGNILHGAGVVLLIVVLGLAYLVINTLASLVRTARNAWSRLFG